MSLIHTYNTISQLKGEYKTIITQPLKIIGKSVLFYLENILDTSISTCDNKPYLKNRKLLKKIEIGRGNTLKINNFKHSLHNCNDFILKKYFSLFSIENKEFQWEDNIYYLNIIANSNIDLYDTGEFPIGSNYDYSYKIVISSDKSKEVIDKFILKSMEFYRKDICEDFCLDNETKVYIYDDGYWDLLYRLPKRKRETVYLPKNMLGKFIDYLDNWKCEKQESWHEEMGIPYKCNILLHGYPGTGKTSLIKTIAGKFNYNIYMLNFNSKLDDTKLMKAIKTVKDNSILVMEDIDCLFAERKKNDEFKNQITFSGLLNILDGVASKPGLITFLTTNYKMKLDKALLRPGRIDYQIEFSYSTKDQIQAMYNKFFTENSDEDFDSFWKKIKKLKLTMSLLQTYFYQCYQSEEMDIIKNIDELKKNAVEHNYENKFQDTLYN
jgi:hypothetical protein